MGKDLTEVLGTNVGCFIRGAARLGGTNWTETSHGEGCGEVPSHLEGGKPDVRLRWRAATTGRALVAPSPSSWVLDHPLRLPPSTVRGVKPKAGQGLAKATQ